MILGLSGKSSEGARAATLSEREHRALVAQIEAINKVQAVIEFELDGTIITANDNFLNCMGYVLSEIQGQHHSIFVSSAERSSTAYSDHWARLRQGEFAEGEFHRINKQGRDVWIQASYNPIMDADGSVYKVIKFATDITEQKLRTADYEGQIAAIHKSQAVIEFSLDGTVLNANQHFLDALGYRLDEVTGKHHRMFVPQELAEKPEYLALWESLRRGEFKAGEFNRVSKSGKSIWIQASYNPVMDLNGNPFKVVKYATDITEQVELRETIEVALDETSKAMKALSDGDLTQRMQGEFEGKFAILQQDVNNCFSKLNSTLSEIHTVADRVRGDTTSIAGGNENLSHRTQQQAASVEETAAAMEEMTSAVSQNAENTNQANRFVLSAADKAKEGGETVDSAIEAMLALDDSSKKIANIIGVIDEIAFQTNLLALNAAVEAARAGEQGRGFAVVASEVRGLAGRSSDAAKEIKDLIKDSEKKVEESSALVNRSGVVLKEIVDSVVKVKELVGDIATAGREQSDGISGVNQSLTQIDEITQRNSALVEEATAASNSLNQRAQDLTGLVASFKLGSAEGDNASSNVVSLRSVG